MPSAESESKFEYATERPFLREIESVEVTDNILTRCSIPHPIILDYDFKAAYERYWARKGLPERHIAVVRNPNISGEPFGLAPTNPFEGALASHKGTNVLSIRDTRSTAFHAANGKYTLMKGTGNLVVADSAEAQPVQFGEKPKKYKTYETAVQMGWGSVGGLLEVDALEESRAFMLADLYQRIFHDDPPMRLPAHFLNIDEAIKREGSLSPEFPADKYHHIQTQYEVDTPVRTIYGLYLADLEELWFGLDLESEDGKTEALEYLNNMFSAYVKKYAKGPVKPIVQDELKKVFEIIDQKRKIYVGPEDSDQPINDGDNEKIAQLKFELAKEGMALGTKFYERNTEAVNRTAKREVAALARMVGMTVAMGIDVHQCANRKDLYGGKISDLSAIRYNYVENFNSIVGDSQTPAEYEDRLRRARDLTPMLSVEAGFTSVQNLAVMMGMPNHAIARLEGEYFNEMLDAFLKTKKYTNQAVKGEIPNAPHFSEAHLKAVAKYERNFEDLAAFVTYGEDINKNRYILLRMLYAAAGAIEPEIEDLHLGKDKPKGMVHLGTHGVNKIPLGSKEEPLEDPTNPNVSYIEDFNPIFGGEPEPWFALNMDFHFDIKARKFVVTPLPIADMRMKPLY